MVTKDLLKKSMETKWRKYQKNIILVIDLIILLIIPLLIIPLNLDDLEPSEIIDTVLIALIPLFIFLLPYTIYCIIAYINSYKLLDDYKIYEVVLDKPSASFMYRGAFYYSINFKTESGEYKSFDTPSMFGNFLNPFTIEDYNNQTVLIAYSEKKEKVVLLSKKERGNFEDEWL